MGQQGRAVPERLRAEPLRRFERQLESEQSPLTGDDRAVRRVEPSALQVRSYEDLVLGPGGVRPEGSPTWQLISLLVEQEPAKGGRLLLGGPPRFLDLQQPVLANPIVARRQLAKPWRCLGSQKRSLGGLPVSGVQQLNGLAPDAIVEAPSRSPNTLHRARVAIHGQQGRRRLNDPTRATLNAQAAHLQRVVAEQRERAVEALRAPKLGAAAIGGRRERRLTIARDADFLQALGPSDLAHLVQRREHPQTGGVVDVALGAAFDRHHLLTHFVGLPGNRGIDQQLQRRPYDRWFSRGDFDDGNRARA